MYRHFAGLLTIGIIALLLPSTAFAGSLGKGGGVTVIKDVQTETDVEAIVMPGCSGDFIPMLFTGVNTTHVRIHPDGTVSIAFQSRETASWTEDGVDHAVPFTNNWSLINMDPSTLAPHVFTITLHGVGTASDGTTDRLSLIGHTVIASDGTVQVDFSRGATLCGL